jgi:hypothetical protein
LEITYSKAIDGNSNTALKYNYIDEFPFTGANYYRLKQMDISGTSDYSNVVMLNFSGDANQVRIYPNPVKSVLNIESKGNKKIVIVNAIGQVILDRTIIDNEISSVQNVDCSVWTKGIYFVRVTDNYSFQ